MKRLMILALMAITAMALHAVELDTLQIQHVDGNGRTQQGILICNKVIANDLREIFAELYKAKYPIERIRPISEYDNDDERSMRANNTSCYCYRVVEGSTKLSKHAQGLAIDINPLYNPCRRRTKNGRWCVEPATAVPYCDRTKTFRGKIDRQDLCYRLFTARGFTWGGNWRTLKDWQHFEK